MLADDDDIVMMTKAIEMNHDDHLAFFKILGSKKLMHTFFGEDIVQSKKTKKEQNNDKVGASLKKISDERKKAVVSVDPDLMQATKRRKVQAPPLGIPKAAGAPRPEETAGEKEVKRPGDP